MKRSDQITAIAGIILGGMQADITGELTYASVRERNRVGWTIETSAPLGNVLRTEGIVLSEEELKQAYHRAAKFLVALDKGDYTQDL